MKNTLVNIAGKLPRALIALYGDIGDVAKSLDIDFLVVGAIARDLVLVHGFGATIERGTRDVYFGVNVSSWEDFETPKAQLIERGFEQDKQKAHRFTRSDSQNMPREVDIVPFGNIAADDSTISWPPDQAVVMSVLGSLVLSTLNLLQKNQDSSDHLTQGNAFQHRWRRMRQGTQ